MITLQWFKSLILTETQYMDQLTEQVKAVLSQLLAIKFAFHLTDPGDIMN